MKRIAILVLILAAANPAFAWRSYSRFHLGSEANGIGGAYVADATTEISMNYNPAGLCQINKQLSFNYEVSSTIVLIDIFAKNLAKQVMLNMDYFPFFSAMGSIGKWRFGTSISTLFYAYGGIDLSVRSWKFTAAYPILDNLSVGIGLGPVFAAESDARGYSFSWNIGVLWKVSERWKVGASFQSPIDITWSKVLVGSTLYEHYPLIIDAGASFALTPSANLFFSLEYLDMDSTTYVLDGIDDSPDFGVNLFARLHPHAGIRFLERFTGAHLSFGLMMDSDYHNNGSYNLYLVTVGVRAYGRNTIFNASIVDSLLIGMFTQYTTHHEKIDVSFSFKVF